LTAKHLTDILPRLTVFFIVSKVQNDVLREINMKKILAAIFLATTIGISNLECMEIPVSARIKLDTIDEEICSTAESTTLNGITTAKGDKDQITELLEKYVAIHNQHNPPKFFKKFPPFFFCNLITQNNFQEAVNSALGKSLLDVTPWFSRMRNHVFAEMLRRDPNTLPCCRCIQG